MHDWLAVELARERNAQILAEDEERRLARLAAESSLRARMARKQAARAVPHPPRSHRLPNSRARTRWKAACARATAHWWLRIRAPLLPT